MSASAPLVDVITQLGPDVECAPCARLAFPEHKLAVAIHKGVPVCRRCHNLRRAQDQATSAAVCAALDESQATNEELVARSEAAASAAVELAAQPAPTAEPKPRILSKDAYFEQFGPANNDDLAGMVRTLLPGQVFILPFNYGESAGHAKRRALKLIPALPAPPPPTEISPTMVCSSPKIPGIWKISVKKQHRHVVIEREVKHGETESLVLPEYDWLPDDDREWSPEYARKENRLDPLQQNLRAASTPLRSQRRFAPAANLQASIRLFRQGESELFCSPRFVSVVGYVPSSATFPSSNREISEEGELSLV